MGEQFNFKLLKAQTREAAIDEVEDLVEQAKHDRGHGGYTGSLAEVNGIIMHNTIVPY